MFRSTSALALGAVAGHAVVGIELAAPVHHAGFARRLGWGGRGRRCQALQVGHHGLQVVGVQVLGAVGHHVGHRAHHRGGAHLVRVAEGLLVARSPAALRSRWVPTASSLATGR